MQWRNLTIVLALLVGVAIGLVYFSEAKGHLRGEPVKELLLPYTNSTDADKKMVALALIGNYTETRQIAALWSGLYWGFTWAAAVLGALSGLILKLESFLHDDKIRKDIAALFTVTAAIMITVSTGGDFQRKWRTNRAAAAQIEQLGYDFVSKNGDQAGTYLTKLSSVLMQRHMSILGMPEEGEVRQPVAISPMSQK